MVGLLLSCCCCYGLKLRGYCYHVVVIEVVGLIERVSTRVVVVVVVVVAQPDCLPTLVHAPWS